MRVYDNNYPNDLGRYVEINTVSQTWSYNLGWAIWTGDRNTKTLGVVPVSEYGREPKCPWCDNALGKMEPSDAPRQQVWFSGPGHLLISDTQGRRLGYSGVQYISEIPDAYGGVFDGGLGVETEPIYDLPVSAGYSILLDGQTASQTDNVSISQFGPGYAAQLNNIQLRIDSQDHITIAEDGRMMTYESSGHQSATLSMSIDEPEASYGLEVRNAEIDAGQHITVAADETSGKLTYGNAQASDGTYGLFVRRVNLAGSKVFAHGEIAVAAGDTHYADYQDWDGEGSITLSIDHGSNGTIDETVILANQIRVTFLPLVQAP